MIGKHQISLTMIKKQERDLHTIVNGIIVHWLLMSILIQHFLYLIVRNKPNQYTVQNIPTPFTLAVFGEVIRLMQVILLIIPQVVIQVIMPTIKPHTIISGGK